MTATEEEFERDLRAALQPLADAIERPVSFSWHSSTLAEDGRLLVLFDADDGHAWGLTLDPARPLDGQPVTFRRMS